MKTTLLRPTFSLKTTLSTGQILERIRIAVASNSENIQIQFAGEHAMMSVAESVGHFWSPWLHLEVREVNSSQEVYGRFSPHPSIWTGFILAYLAMATLTLFSFILGISQLLASQTPWGFGLILVWILVCVALWAASQVGQKLAAQEMELMAKTVEQSIKAR